MACEVRRHGDIRRQEASGAGVRERQAEEAIGRVDDGCRDVERDARKISEARFQEKSRGLGDDGEGLCAMASLWVGADRSARLPLHVDPCKRRGPAPAIT